MWVLFTAFLIFCITSFSDRSRPQHQETTNFRFLHGKHDQFFPASLCSFRSFDMCTLVVRHNAIQRKNNCRNGQKLMVMFGQLKGKFDVAVVR